MSELISREDFESYLNTGFTTYFTEGNPTPLTLIDVTDRRFLEGYEVFSLTFLGPVDGPIFQENLTTEHPQLGTFELSLVPIGRDETGTQYQALFNRKMQSPEPEAE